MRVNGLLRKSQLRGKTGRAYDGTLPHAPARSHGTLPHAPVARSRTLPWHAPVARSRGTLPYHAPPRARAPAGTIRSQAQNPNGKHIYQRATVKDLKINLLGKT